MGFFDENPLFVDTNLGTHFALSVPPDITVGDLKCKLIQEHFSCFMNIGAIKVHGLMVKRRSHFYHLPDSMPLKTAFQGFSGTWFLKMHVSLLRDMPASVPSTVLATGQGSPVQVVLIKSPTSTNLIPLEDSQHFNDQSKEFHIDQDCVSNISDVTDCSQSETVIAFRYENCRQENLETLSPPAFAKNDTITRRTTKNITKDSSANGTHVLELISGLNSEREKQLKENNAVSHFTEDLHCNDRSFSETPLKSRQREAPSMNDSEKLSITAIISRYFSDFDEVNSCRDQPKHELEESHNNDLNTCTPRVSGCSVDQRSPKRVLESDTHTICSVNSVAATNAKQFDTSFEDTNSVAAFSQIGKASTTSRRKAKKASSHFVVKKKASRSRVLFCSPSSEKAKVGKRLIQAANTISVSGSGKRSSRSVLASRCGKSTPAKIVRHMAFDVDDFGD